MRIPHVLVAPARQIGPQLPPELQREHDDDVADQTAHAHGDGDGGGGGGNRHPCAAEPSAWYEDGAYIAHAQSDGGDDDGHAQSPDADRDDQRSLREAYFAAVLARYRRLRSLLRSEPPQKAARRIAATRQTSAAPLEGKSTTHKTWSALVRTTDPHPLQLALLSKDSVIRILRVLLGGRLLRRGHSLSERTSRWIWALLARLPDPWELDHTEIGWVRDLGRRAVLLGTSLARMAALREEMHDGGLGVDEAADHGCSVDLCSDDDGSDVSPSCAQQAAGPPCAAPRAGAAPDSEDEEGQVTDDGGSVAMDLSSPAPEAGDHTTPARAVADGRAALEAAKKAFLARLASADTAGEEDASRDVEGGDDDDDDDGDYGSDGSDNGNAARDEARMRLRVNMRATLNMILTVAGDFYGQRDLLPFRQPFVGL